MRFLMICIYFYQCRQRRTGEQTPTACGLTSRTSSIIAWVVKGFQTCGAQPVQVSWTEAWRKLASPHEEMLSCGTWSNRRAHQPSILAVGHWKKKLTNAVLRSGFQFCEVLFLVNVRVARENSIEHLSATSHACDDNFLLSEKGTWQTGDMSTVWIWSQRSGVSHVTWNSNWKQTLHFISYWNTFFVFSRCNLPGLLRGTGRKRWHCQIVKVLGSILSLHNLDNKPPNYQFCSVMVSLSIQGEITRKSNDFSFG
jgi:hypothetical protein